MSFQEIMNFSIMGRTVSQLCSTVVLVILLIIVMKIINRIFSAAIEKLHVERSLHTFFKSFIRVTLYFIAVLIVAGHLDINVTSLLALFSVASLAISMAIQGTMTNMVNGIMIFITKPFIVGEFIETAGVSGTVHDITLLRTQLLTADNKLINIPNSDISSTRTINYTHMKNRRVDLMVTATYNSDIDTVMTVLRQAIDATSDILKDPAPEIHVQDYQLNFINYNVRVWTETEKYWDVYYALTEEIRHQFTAAGIYNVPADAAANMPPTV